MRDREARCALNCTEHFMTCQKRMGEGFTATSPEAALGLREVKAD